MVAKEGSFFPAGSALHAHPSPHPLALRKLEDSLGQLSSSAGPARSTYRAGTILKAYEERSLTSAMKSRKGLSELSA